MYGHCAFAVVRTFQADVVFKIFAYDLQYLEVFLWKFLGFLIFSLLRLGKLLDLFLKLTDRKLILDHEIAKIFLKLEIFHSEKNLGMSHAEKSDLQVVLQFCWEFEQAKEIGH